MDPDDHVCLCFRVSLRKLQTYLAVEKPAVASQLSNCFGAGTGCHWCVPYLQRLHAQWKAGEMPSVSEPPDEYAARRDDFRKAKQ